MSPTYTTFCSLTGGCQLQGNAAVLDDIEEAHRYLNPEGLYANLELEIPAWARKKLAYTNEDVEASRDYVLLTPCKKDGSVAEWREDFSLSEDERPNNENIALVIDVMHIPDLEPDPRLYYKLQVHDRSRLLFISNRRAAGKRYIMTFTSFQIFRHICPELKLHDLYHMFSEVEKTQVQRHGAVNGVDYGPTGAVHNVEDPSYWFFLADEAATDQGLEYGALEWWINLLMKRNSDKTEDELVEEAWMGGGNLWTMVRPDRFPIHEAMQIPELSNCNVASSHVQSSHTKSDLHTIPFDIYDVLCDFLPIRDLTTLLSLNRHIRSLLIPHIHVIAYRKVQQDTPWYLPVPNLRLRQREIPWAKDEMDYWIDEWQKYGFQSGELNTRVPWLNYAKACRRSCSMRNRKRIWGISLQLKSLVVKHGLLDK